MDPELRVIYSCDVWVGYRPASAKGDGIYDKLRHSICEISTVDYISNSMIREESIVSRDVLSGIHNARCVEHPHDLPTRVGIMNFHLYSILAGAQHHHPYHAHNNQIPRLGPGKTSACLCLLRETKRRKGFTLQCI